MEISLSLSLTGRLLSSAFSPALLFALAEPGVWYDPSDLTTLFQDTAGTTPVTTPGQTVALALDKSKGLVLGSELVTSGVFAAPLSISNGVGANQAIGTVVGVAYRVSYRVTAFSGSGSVRLSLGTTGLGLARTATGTYSEVILTPAGGSPNNVYAFISASTSATIDNISVKELPGFHATQATAASRPTYGIVPATGRRNLLTRTEEFDNAAWSKPAGTTTISANTATAPNGTMTADLVTAAAGSANHYVAQNNSTTGSVTATIYAKAGTASWLGLGSGYTNGVETAWFDLSNGTVGTVASGGTATITSAGNGWWRCSHTRSSWTGGAILPFVTNANGVAVFNAAGTENLLLWGAQLETGSTATAYQRVGSAFDVTEAGVASLSYLSFDGVDDFMVTPTITPGTDKAQVFAGVRKLGNGMIAELSVSADANNGSFYYYTGEVGAGDLSAGLRGTQTTKLIGSAATLPVTRVETVSFDTAGASRATEIFPRVNGATASGSGFGAADAGTGNFLAYPLYIGRRAGTSFPFNGNLFSLIIRFGANLDAGTITSTETWVAGKTGVTL